HGEFRAVLHELHVSVHVKDVAAAGNVVHCHTTHLAAHMGGVGIGVVHGDDGALGLGPCGGVIDVRNQETLDPFLEVRVVSRQRRAVRVVVEAPASGRAGGGIGGSIVTGIPLLAA